MKNKYNGNKVQMAFKYKTDGNSTCGGWSIKSLFDKRKHVPTTIKMLMLKKCRKTLSTISRDEE